MPVEPQEDPRPIENRTHFAADDCPPDGGYGWVCVFSVASINAHTWGLNSAYAVFLSHYLSSNAFPGATSLEYALIGGLSISMAFLIAPLATTSTRIFSTRTTLLIGVFFETASFIGASFVTRIWQLFLSQGVCFGWGMGFQFVASVGVIPQWFTSRRSLANGIGAAGSGLGGLMYSLAANAMIEKIGLPWAFRTLGIISFVVNTCCSLLVKDRNDLVGSQQNAFEYRMLKRYEFCLLQLYGVLSMLGYVVLLFSLPSYARSINLTAQQGSVVGAIFQLGQMLGRPPVGYFSDAFGRINMAGSMSFFCAFFSMVIWTNAKSYGVLIFFSLVAGCVAGTYWAVIAPVTAEIVGLKAVPSALSITWIALVLPTTFSEAIALRLVGIHNGNYLACQLFTGSMYLGAFACMLLLKCWKVGDLDRTQREQLGSSTASAAKRPTILDFLARGVNLQRV